MAKPTVRDLQDTMRALAIFEETRGQDGHLKISDSMRTLGSFSASTKSRWGIAQDACKNSSPEADLWSFPAVKDAKKNRGK